MSKNKAKTDKGTKKNTSAKKDTTRQTAPPATETAIAVREVDGIRVEEQSLGDPEPVVETSSAAPVNEITKNEDGTFTVKLHRRVENKAIRYGQPGVFGSLRFSKNMFGEGQHPDFVILTAANLAQPNAKSVAKAANSEARAAAVQARAEKAKINAEKAQARAAKALERAQKLAARAGLKETAPETAPATT